jgi:hypothetical protein
MRRFYITAVAWTTLLVVSSHVCGQGESELKWWTPSNAVYKVDRLLDGSSIYLGHYLDTSTRSSHFPGGTNSLFIKNSKTGKSTFIKAGKVIYFGRAQDEYHKLIKIGDSTFAYLAEHVDTFQYLQRLDHSLIQFYGNGDTARTIHIETKLNFPRLDVCVYLTDSNQFICAGRTTNYLWDTIFVLKIDSNGKQLWSRKLQKPTSIRKQMKSLYITGSDECLLLGSIEEEEPPPYDFEKYWFFKFRPSTGATISEKTVRDSIAYGESAHLTGYLQLHNGNILTTAYPFASDVTSQYYLNNMHLQFVALFSSNGNLLKKIPIGMARHNYRPKLQLANGEIILLGRVITEDMHGERLYKTALLKLDTSLNIVWRREYVYDSTYNYNFTMDITTHPSGGFVLVGSAHKEYTDTTTAAWIVKTDSMGCIVPGCGLATGVPHRILDNLTQFFPNPVGNHLFFRNEPSVDGTLKIFNTSGILVKEQLLNGVDCHSVDVTELLPGLYILKVTSSAGTVVSRIVKQ